jgi:hypothetical protein
MPGLAVCLAKEAPARRSSRAGGATEVRALNVVGQMRGGDLQDFQTCLQACRNALSLAKKWAEAAAREAKRLEGVRARVSYERRMAAAKEPKAQGF